MDCKNISYGNNPGTNIKIKGHNFIDRTWDKNSCGEIKMLSDGHFQNHLQFYRDFTACACIFSFSGKKVFTNMRMQPLYFCKYRSGLCIYHSTSVQLSSM